ncbi:heme biosynthesis HemY N-terminal domain-containing protein [Stutzerimonas tarimensis]|uniref:Heme biosynthesis HemY N-terminal domain-containing protein n=1 Tax=Stutzerimonas tarimensis TaxID=1507735 RepID=A0ABV7T382_9GAMM
MKRLALSLVLLLAVLGGLGWAFLQSPGYVLITYDRFRYESTFWVFLGILFVLWLLAFLLNRLLGLLVASGALVNPWSRKHRQRRIGKASRLGQRELAEGQWNQALDHLRVAADKDGRPLMHYLGAARAANEMRQYAEADALLDEAMKREPDATLAVGLTRARLLIDRGEYADARDLLKTLHQDYPRNVQVMQLLQQLHVQLQEWVALCTLLPELRKLKVLPTARLDELERLAWTAALESLGNVEEPEREEALVKLQQRWQSVPTGLRQDPVVVRAYSDGLVRLGAEAKAEDVLHGAIKRHFSPLLVEPYGRVHGDDPVRQLARAEAWLKDHPDDPALLLALGRLCLRNELWGKARGYLESSLRFAHRPETCAELARLLARLGEVERSNLLFQEGLGLLDRSLPVLR